MQDDVRPSGQAEGSFAVREWSPSTTVISDSRVFIHLSFAIRVRIELPDHESCCSLRRAAVVEYADLSISKVDGVEAACRGCVPKATPRSEVTPFQLFFFVGLANQNGIIRKFCLPNCKIANTVCSFGKATMNSCGDLLGILCSHSFH